MIKIVMRARIFDFEKNIFVQLYQCLLFLDTIVIDCDRENSWDRENIFLFQETNGNLNNIDCYFSKRSLPSLPIANHGWAYEFNSRWIFS